MEVRKNAGHVPVTLSTFERVLAAEHERIRQSIVEQLSRPLWWLGTQPDSTRSGWPREYVLFPRLHRLTTRWHRAKRWWRDHVPPAIEVLRHGERECGEW